MRSAGSGRGRRPSIQQRTALVLKFQEDMKIEDIATVMGKSSGAVKLLIHRGVSKLPRRRRRAEACRMSMHHDRSSTTSCRTRSFATSPTCWLPLAGGTPLDEAFRSGLRRQLMQKAWEMARAALRCGGACSHPPAWPGSARPPDLCLIARLVVYKPCSPQADSTRSSSTARSMAAMPSPCSSRSSSSSTSRWTTHPLKYDARRVATTERSRSRATQGASCVLGPQGVTSGCVDRGVGEAPELGVEPRDDVIAEPFVSGCLAPSARRSIVTWY